MMKAAMRKTVGLPLLALLTLFSAARLIAEDIKPQDVATPTVRGMRFGSTTFADVSAAFHFPPHACATGWVEDGVQGEVCATGGVIGNVQTTDYFRFRRGVLYRIEMNFPTSDYPAIRAAFVAKYGTPLAETDTFQNGFGATFTRERLSWIGRTLVVKLRQSPTPPLLSGRERGLVEFILRGDYDEAIAKAKEKAAKAVTDF